MVDPNPLVNSEGIATLQRAGIAVDVVQGAEADRAKDLIADFVERILGGWSAPPPVADWAGRMTRDAAEAAAAGQAAFAVMLRLQGGEGGGGGGSQEEPPRGDAALPTPSSTAVLDEALAVAMAALRHSFPADAHAGDAAPTGQRTWYVGVDSASSASQGGAALGMTLFEAGGGVLLSCVVNPVAHPSSCVAVAVKGSGVRYWPRVGDAGGQMFLSRPDNMRRCWDQVIDLISWLLASRGVVLFGESSSDSAAASLARCCTPGLVHPPDARVAKARPH